MKKTTKNLRANERNHRRAHVAATPATSAVAWAPEPCGLSRAELRAIVAEMLG